MCAACVVQREQLIPRCVSSFFIFRCASPSTTLLLFRRGMPLLICACRLF